MTSEIIFRPMLAGKADLNKVKFPTMLSPKLDGIRAIVIDGVVYGRSLKPIPNVYVQKLFGHPHLHGYDGELIVGPINGKDVFRQTTSGVMSRDGKPEVMFCVFDRWDLDYPWKLRYDLLDEVDGDYVYRVPHHKVTSYEEIDVWEDHYLLQGYEGVMLRDPNGPYKQGRSTTREGWLLKVKRFEDSEAWVIGMEERMHNANELQTNELGYAKRTSHQENLIGTGVMGALIVQDIKTGVEFNIGTGFTDEERAWWWQRYNSFDYDISYTVMNNGGQLVTVHEDPFDLVKYSYFPTGGKDKPRFPTYLGLRTDL